MNQTPIVIALAALVAGHKVVDVADFRGPFERNRQCSEIAEERSGVGSVGDGEQSGNCGDRRWPNSVPRQPRCRAVSRVFGSAW